MKTDLYQRITDRIVAQLEAGTRPWIKPWSGTPQAGQLVLPLRANGIPYRGINVLMLWGAAEDNGYASRHWMTYQQARELGGQVRKGETGSLVVFASKLTRSEEDAGTGEEIARQIPFLRSYTVFNAQQVDGLSDSYRISDIRQAEPFARIDAAERFVAATGATVRHGGNRACYAPGPDIVQMPPREAFRDPDSYYATLAHELTHWTGHTARLGREFGKRFADKAYAFEELVAELGSAFVAAGLGLALEPRADHADYLAHWLGILKADRRAIFTAASHAQSAADFLAGQASRLEEAA